MATMYDGPDSEYEPFKADEAICDVRISNSAGQFINITSNPHSPFANQMFSGCSYLDMDLSIDDDAESSEHNCKLTVYNLILDPEKYDTSNDVKHTIDINLYWKNDPKHTTHYKFVVDYKETNTERSGADWKTTFVGTLTQNIILKNVNFYKDYRESCEDFGGEKSAIFCPRLSKLAAEVLKMYGIQINYGTCGDIELRVYLEGKSLYDIINEYADYAYLNLSCKCIIINEYNIAFYRTVQQLEVYSGGEQGKIAPVAERINLAALTDSRFGVSASNGVQSERSLTSDTVTDNATRYQAETNSNVVVAIRYEHLIKYKRANNDIKIECYGLPNVRKGKCFIIDYGLFDYQKLGMPKQQFTYFCNEIHVKYDITGNGWTQEINAVCTEDIKALKDELTLTTEELSEEVKPNISPEVAPDIEPKKTLFLQKLDYHKYWSKIANLYKEYTLAGGLKNDIKKW